MKFDYKNIYHGGCQMLEFDLALKEINEGKNNIKYLSNIIKIRKNQKTLIFILKIKYKKSIIFI